MKILTNQNGYVDLEAPIYMGEDYKKKFIEFFKKMFPGKVEIKEVKEIERNFGEREETTNHHWVPKDYSLLLTELDNDEIAEKLKLSDMAIIIKRGSFVPDFLSWMKKKGYKKHTLKIIEEFFRETGEPK